MSYEKLYKVGFAICTLFSLTMFSSNLEKIERVYSAKNEVKTSIGVLETKTDRKENLQKTIQTIWNKIAGTQSFALVAWNNIQKKTIEKSENTVKSVKNIEQVKSYEKSNNKIIWITVKSVEKNSMKKVTPSQSVFQKYTLAMSVEKNSLIGKIYRNWWNDPRVQYAYNISGGDIDFIKTIEAESKWDVNALWDKGKSFWLCQIHKWYNPTMQKAYRALKTDNEKVKMCYDQYKDWVNRGVIKTRLYWYNVRNKPQNKKPFTIK